MSRSAEKLARDGDAAQVPPEASSDGNATQADDLAFAATCMPEIVATSVTWWSIAQADEHAELELDRLFKALEQISAFFGALAVLEYVRYESPKDTRNETRKSRGAAVQRPEADIAVAFLREDNLLSWGNWKHLRRNCFAAFAADPKRMFCPEVYELDRKFRADSEALDAALDRRNAWEHGIAGNPEQLQGDLNACRATLLGLLHELRFLGNLRLVRVLASTPEEPGRLELLVEDRTGSSPSSPFRPRYRRYQ